MKLRNSLLLPSLLIMTLVISAIAGNRVSTPEMMSTPRSAQPSSETHMMGTFEIILEDVDAWGGVTDIVLSMQNATHYSNPHVQLVEDIMADQMAHDAGYVTSVNLNVDGMVAFPNGIMGGPMVTLTLRVEPVLIVPSDRSGAYFENVTPEMAIQLAEEVVSAYETELGINLERLSLMMTSTYYYVDLTECVGNTYTLVYVSLLTASQANVVIPRFLDKLALMGGFMSLVEASGWQPLQAAALESIMAAKWLPYYDDVGSAVLSLFTFTDEPYIRPHPTHSDLYTRVNTLLIGVAALQEPGYVEASAGDESYSLKQHVGYVGNIKNKMAEDSSAASLSAIIAAAPAAGLEVDGWPSNLLNVNDQFKIPEDIELPGGMVIPANTTVSEVIRTFLSYLPIEFAYMVNEQLGLMDPTFFDDIVEYLWGGTTMLPDFKDMILSLNFSNAPQMPIKEMNFDLLRLIMERAGMNPNALISRLNPSLAATNPLMAIVDAFVRYFDSYHILDLLANEIYGDPVALENYFNTFIAGIEQFLKDFAGADFAEQFQTKEGLAEFIEEHWDIVLQALWDAMAADDLAAIKDAIHAMLNATNLQKHITPYLMADLGISLVAGIGYFIGVNLDSSTFIPNAINVADLVLKFDADPEELNIHGPYLIVTKYVEDRTVNVGENVQFNITVHNYGDATAYDIKVLDSANAGFDGERPFYWTRDTLAPGATWEISFNVVASEAGLYMDMPVLCVYFNVSLSLFDPEDPCAWQGTARYTTSAFGYQIQVVGAGNWWEGTVLGIPTLVVVGAAAGAAIVGVAILLVRRR